MSTSCAVRRFVVWSVVVSLVLLACATRKVPPIGAGGQPFRPEADERAIWSQAEKEAEAILERVKIYDDPLLVEYLAKLGDRMLPENIGATGGPQLKIIVLQDPTLSAFAMPNGRLYVHTGLLSRVDNEAQLATVLGHELRHYTNRDALKFSRDRCAQRVPATVLGVAASSGVAAAAGSQARAGDAVGAAVLSPTASVILGLGLRLAAIASITGYGRDLEREADVEGLKMLVAAGYDPTEAPRVFQLLGSDSGDRGPLETFFFGTRPRLQERIDGTQELLRTTYAQALLGPSRVRNTEEFALRMRPVVRDNAALDIRAGRFTLAQAQLDRVLAVTPRDPIAHLYYGDLHRLQSQRARTAAEKAEHVHKALERYERASELDPTYPDPFRQLGFLYYQEKDIAKAHAAFEKYLALAPDAPDAPRIRAYRIELMRVVDSILGRPI